MMGQWILPAGRRGIVRATVEEDDAPTMLVMEIAKTLAPGIAIDLACGAGRNALYLADTRLGCLSGGWVGKSN